MNIKSMNTGQNYFKHRIFVLIAIISLFLIGLVGCVSGDVTLTSETVTSTGTNLYWTSIGSDGSGNPFIFSDGKLYHREGSAWVTNAVNPLSGSDASVVIDQQQNAHVFYSYSIASNNYALYHAEWNPSIPAGSTCIMEQIRTRPDYAPSNPEYGYSGDSEAVLDSSGKINLIFDYHSGSWGPLYTKQTTSGWSTPVRIKSGYIWTGDFSLKVDENDNLYVAFINNEAFENPKGLYFGKKTPSGTWVNEQVIQGSGIIGTALVVDQGIVRIVYGYYNSSTQKSEVKMASRQTDGTWIHELLFDDATGGVQAIDAEIKDGVLYVVLGHGSGSSDNKQPVLISKELPAGTPTYQRFGPASSTERASVSMAQSSQNLLISHNFNRNTLIYTTVEQAQENRAPVLDPIGSKSVNEGTALMFIVSATDADNNPLTYSSSGLPAGATFDAGTRTFTWTNPVVGTYSVTFTVSDGTLTDTETVTVKVINPYVWSSIGPDGKDIRSIAVSPTYTTDHTIIAGSNMPGTFLRTEDDGVTWTMNNFLADDNNKHFDSIAFMPGGNQEIYLGGGNSAGILHSTDGGQTWLTPTPSINVWDYAIASDGTVFAAPGFTGIYRKGSADTGFSLITTGLSEVVVAVAVSPTFTSDHTVYVGSNRGVYKSIDGGLTWVAVNTGIPANAQLKDLVISPDNTAVFCAVSMQGIYRSTDGGTSWTRVNSEGYSFRYQSFAVSPDYANDHTIFASYYSQIGSWYGVAMSQDGGDNWVRLANTASFPGTNTALMGISPAFANDRTIFAGITNGIYKIRVKHVPVLAAIGAKSIPEGQPLSFTVSATDGDAGDSLTYSSSGLPSGAMFDAGTRTFTWTPGFNQGQALPYLITFMVSDGTFTDTEEVAITVTEANVAPVLAAIGPQSVVAGQPLTFTATASDANIPAQSLTFSLSGSVPGGASITSAGDFTWTPTTAGSFIFDVVVSDGSLTDSETITVSVAEFNVAPVLAAIGPQSVVAGQPLTFTATASDANIPAQPLTFSLSGTVPGGASITSAGDFTWTPTTAGSFTFDVVVSDGSLTDSEVVIITVSDGTTGTTVVLKDSQETGIAGANVSYYQGGWKSFGTTGADGSVTMQLSSDLAQVSFRVSYGGATLDKKQDIKTNPMVTFQTTLVTASLKDSSAAPIGTGNVTYYAGGWKDFGTLDASGTAAKELLPGNYSFRMSYAGASMDTKQNVTINPAVAFQTANVMVELRDGSGGLITADNAGTVKYYAGGWRDFGMTTGGTCTKELLPLNYTFRMTYQGKSNDKAQNVSENTLVTFLATTPVVTVRLTDSAGNPLAGGTVQYYAGGWKEFGTTGTDGNAVKELLPGNYSFRMTYASGSKDLQQDVGTIPTVVFATTNTRVELRNSNGVLIIEPNAGTVQYYAGGWKPFGSTNGGSVSKELLAGNYSFRMTYQGTSNDKAQDIGVNPVVVFQTGGNVATVRLIDSSGNGIAGGSVQYYSGGWKEFGITGADGNAVKELLPGNYSFRMTYASGSIDKKQDTSTGPVIFQTKNVEVKLINSTGRPIDSGSVQYYAGGWKSFGTTINGIATKELLPAQYSFRMSYASGSIDKSQDISSNPFVIFQTKNVEVKLINSTGQPIDSGSVQYYAGGWKSFGTTINGIATKELLPAQYSFRMSYASGSIDKSQDITTDSMVLFQTGKVVSTSGNCTQYYAGGWKAFTNGIDLLPNTYKFRFKTGTPDKDYTITAGLVNTIQ